LARYGIKEVFNLSVSLNFLPYRFNGGFSINQPWRLIFFILVMFSSLLSGFRSMVVIFALTLFFQFLFEKLYKTRLLPLFIGVGLLGAAIALPLASSLPLSMQRALSVLPFLEI